MVYKYKSNVTFLCLHRLAEWRVRDHPTVRCACLYACCPLRYREPSAGILVDWRSQSCSRRSRGLQLDDDEDRQTTKTESWGRNVGGRTSTSASRYNHDRVHPFCVLLPQDFADLKSARALISIFICINIHTYIYMYTPCYSSLPCLLCFPPYRTLPTSRARARCTCSSRVLYMYMCTYMYVYKCIHMYIHTYIHTYTCILLVIVGCRGYPYVYKKMHMYIPTYIHMHVRIYACRVTPKKQGKLQ